MNALDYFILLVLSLSIIYSLFRGLIHEFFSVMSIILSFIVGVKYYSSAGDQISGWFHNRIIADFIGFVLIVSGLYIGMSLVRNLLKRFVKFIHLGLVDRILGGLLGLLKGIAGVTFILLLLISFLPHAHPLLAQSKLSPYFAALGEIPLTAVPEKIRALVENKQQALDPYWNGITDNKMSHSEPKELPNEKGK